ncbi:MAG: tetratricopeptide repeat protein [Acidobacteriota bacterium]|nr:tetratricopeptide repeat protein [Acidobacteriota bacterium]
MKNAQKWTSQGNIKAALEEYKKIIEKDPNDSNTLNLIGDLYLKLPDIDKAIESFLRAAEIHEKQGFNKRAIALYQKILKNKPEQIEISLKLAQLYEKEKLLGDARLYYSNAAEAYRKSGKKEKALEIWKKIAEIDPNSAEVYLKIAETCLQEKQIEEALKAFVEAGNRFFARERFEQALLAYRRAYEIQPESEDIVAGLVRTQLKLGYSDEAALILEATLQKQPFNKRFLILLLDCYLEMENPFQAEMAAIKVIELEPSNYLRLLDVVKLYLKKSDLAGASRALSTIAEHLLLSGQSQELYHWIEQILAKNPEQIEALKLLVSYYAYLHDEKAKKNTLEQLAEAARLNNNIEEEKLALLELIKISPHETQYSLRLQQITSKTEASTTVETAKSFDLVDFQEANSFHSEQEQSFEEFQKTFYQQSDVQKEEKLDEFVTAYDELQQEESNGYGELLYEEIQKQSTAEEALKSRLEDELSSVRYFLSLNCYDIALKSLSQLEEEFGQLEEIQSLKAEIEKNLIATKQQEEAVETQKKQPELDKKPKKIDTSELFEDIIEELGLEREKLSDSAADYDTHYQMGIAYKEMGLLEEAISEFQEAVKLTAPDDGTKRYFYCCNMLGICFMEKRLPNIALMWYQKAMETQGLEEEELQGLRYEIANAYEMSGEKDRAIEFFEQIYAINVNYRDVGQRLAQLQSFRQSDQEGKYSF